MLVLVGGCSQPPTADEIQSDLIGQKMKINFLWTWEFKALSEFVDFEITGKRPQNDLIEYDVEMHLQEMQTGEQYRVKALVVYRKENGVWKIISITNKDMEQV